jgi:hypothetical protein
MPLHLWSPSDVYTDPTSARPLHIFLQSNPTSHSHLSAKLPVRAWQQPPQCRMRDSSTAHNGNSIAFRTATSQSRSDGRLSPMLIRRVRVRSSGARVPQRLPSYPSWVALSSFLGVRNVEGMSSSVSMHRHS